MPLIPEKLIEGLHKFNNLTVNLFGITCNLYIPSNLTNIEGYDMYSTPSEINYTVYYSQKVWIEWHTKNIEKLRKLGLFTEKNTPIIAYFNNTPEVTLNSYIKVPIKYVPGTYDTDEFEVVNIFNLNTYNQEVIRMYNLAPRRVNN